MTDYLSTEQRARIAAARAARELLQASEGFAQSTAPLLEDIVNLTHYLLTGYVDPDVFRLPTATPLDAGTIPVPDPEEEDIPWWADVLALKVTWPDNTRILLDRVPDGSGGYYWMCRAGNDDTLNYQANTIRAWDNDPGVTVEETDPPAF